MPVDASWCRLMPVDADWCWNEWSLSKLIETHWGYLSHRKTIGSCYHQGRVHSKKKIIVNFHNLGLDPPPLKVVKGKNLFFFHTLTETHFGEKNFFSPYKSIKLRKNSMFFPNISKIFGLSGKGVPPPHTEKFFLCIFAWIRTLKKIKKKLWKNVRANVPKSGENFFGAPVP